MDLDLNYEEAIDFIIHLDELNLKHDAPEALKRKARGILINFVNSLNLVERNQAYITDANGFYTAKKNDDESYSIVDPNCYRYYENVTYSSDVIRAFLDDKSLIQRLQEEKEKEATEKNSVSDNTASNVFSEAGRKGGKAGKRNEPLQKFIESFVEKNQSSTFENAWKIWKNACKKKPYNFNGAEINFTENSVAIDGKTMKKQTVKNYFYAAKKVSQ